MKIKDPSCKSF